ncbi:hypothetical protein FC093_12620 [Ilyomonas limi]|uniref:Uncharacterized protein n=1 Tax=Ilyomonas limi TaxID=2575867 RepID=A0A4U3KZ58_9BACT|nr:hypothetical protein [Ilyomonas limi]TKK68051.1 hypothetical protein FC093_12620 [Ilyomonas limi]
MKIAETIDTNLPMLHHEVRRMDNIAEKLIVSDSNHKRLSSYVVSLPLMKKWYQVALFNLVVLALLGLLMRYKMNFPFPVLEQKNILHAHSHFAFNGWIGFLLQVLIVDEFTHDYKKSTRFWNRFFLVSTVVNHAMIFSFAWEGYGAISIALSTAGLWLSYVFAYKIFKTLPAASSKNESIKFVKAALFFMLLSSLGPYALAIIMALHVSNVYWSQNALLFFLHFQYSGWFTFATLAFLIKKLEQSPAFNFRTERAFFLLLAVTCVPSYFYTMLWQHRPETVTVVMAITAILQAISLYFFVLLLYKNGRNAFTKLPAICRWLYTLAVAAYILKVILPFFILHPHVGQLALGLRPIIIGYLHLVFLSFVSMYLLGILADKNIVPHDNRISLTGLVTFAVGITINEILLAAQGLAAMYVLYLPAVSKLLFYNTLILVMGAIVLFAAACKKQACPSFYIKSLKLNI